MADARGQDKLSGSIPLIVSAFLCKGLRRRMAAAEDEISISRLVTAHAWLEASFSTEMLAVPHAQSTQDDEVISHTPRFENGCSCHSQRAQNP